MHGNDPSFHSQQHTAGNVVKHPHSSFFVLLRNQQSRTRINREAILALETKSGSRALQQQKAESQQTSTNLGVIFEMDSVNRHALHCAGDSVSKTETSETSGPSPFVVPDNSNMPVTTSKPAYLKFGFDEDTESPDATPRKSQFCPSINSNAPLDSSNGSQLSANFSVSHDGTERGHGDITALPTEHRPFCFNGTIYPGPILSLDYYEPPLEAPRNQGADNFYDPPPDSIHGHFRQTSYDSLPGTLQGSAIEGFHHHPPPEAFHGPPEDGPEQGFGALMTQMSSPYAIPNSHASPYEIPSQMASPQSMGAQVSSPDQTAGNPLFHTDGYLHFTAPVPFGDQAYGNGLNTGENAGQADAPRFFNPIDGSHHSIAPDFNGHDEPGGFGGLSPAANPFCPAAYTTGTNDDSSGPGETVDFRSTATIKVLDPAKEAWMCTCSCGCRLCPEDQGDRLCWWCDFNPGHDGYGKGPMLGSGSL